MSNGKYKDDDRPSRLALYLSALVWPGAGQFVQKRWLAGLFYAVVFSVCFVFLIIAIFAPMFWNLRLAMEFADTGKGDAFHPISFAKIFLWLGLSALVYIAGLLDTFVSYRRPRRRQLEAGLQEKNTVKTGQD